MHKHSRIVRLPPGSLQGLLVTAALALALTPALSDPIDPAGPDKHGIQRGASHARIGAERSGRIIRDAPSRHGSSGPAISVAMPAQLSVPTTSTKIPTTVRPYQRISKPIKHPEAEGPDTTPAEDEQMPAAFLKSGSCLTDKDHCYVVNLMSSIGPVIMPVPDSLADTGQYVIYTSRFNHDRGNWKRLRLGFLGSTSDVHAVADTLAKQYSQAWATVASNEEVATALATQDSKVEVAALEPGSAAQPAVAEGDATTAAGSLAADHARRYPGYMWSQVREPSDVYDEDGNSIVEGAIQQGVDWLRLGSDTWLNTFAEVGLKRDSDDLNWNNENKLSVGVKLRYFGLKRTLVSVGAKYDLVNRTKSNETREGFTYFADWFSYWDLSDLASSGSGGSSLPLGFPGTAWGQLRYPASQFDEETSDTLIEGAIEQGVDWFRFSDNSFFNTFIEVDYTFDSKDLEWNNKIKWAPGAKVRAFVAKNALLEIGAMYRWQYRTKPNHTKSDPVVFLNWSTSWDFGEFARKSFGNPQ